MENGASKFKIPEVSPTRTGTFCAIAQRPRERVLMHNGAREMNEIHSRAGSCRVSGCEISGNFFGIFPGPGTDSRRRGGRSASGGARASCSERRAGGARKLFSRFYAHLDIHFRSGCRSRGIDFARRESGTAGDLSQPQQDLSNGIRSG